MSFKKSREKAIEYTKFVYGDKYNEPCYHDEVLRVINAFSSGYELCEVERLEKKRLNKNM